MKKLNLGVAALVLGLAVAAPASAAHTGYVGGLLGLAIPMTTGADMAFTFGGEVGYHVMPEVAVGLHFTTFSPATGVTSSFLAAFGDYHFADPKGLYAGALIGLEIGSAGGTSESHLGFGARVGYDVELTPELSVGPEAAFTMSTATGADPVIEVLASVRYGF